MSLNECRYCEACGDCVVCYAEDRCPGTKDGRHIDPRKRMTAQACLSEIRALVDDMGIEAEEHEDAGYWSGKTDAVERVQEILEKYDA